jgi:hypothetical protein
VDHAAALAGEGREPADVHPGRARDLAEPRQLAWLVREDHGEIYGHPR